VLIITLLAAAAVAPARARAQTPDAVELSIERQLLCPQCTNLRLDVCDTQICVDMRASIRERLARGESEQQIVEYFTGVYGQRVLAEVPRRGFNLLLFWWVGASVVAVAAVGSAVLVRLRRSAQASEALSTGGVLDAQTEQWLDEQIAEDTPDRDGRDRH
jgi:cytochrome c-type biogenesis protein CcmH